MKVITKVSRTVTTHTYEVKCYDTQEDKLETLTIRSVVKPLSITAIKKEIENEAPHYKFLTISNHTTETQTYSMNIMDFIGASRVDRFETDNKEEN